MDISAAPQGWQDFFRRYPHKFHFLHHQEKLRAYPHLEEANRLFIRYNHSLPDALLAFLFDCSSERECFWLFQGFPDDAGLQHLLLPKACNPIFTARDRLQIPTFEDAMRCIARYDTQAERDAHLDREREKEEKWNKSTRGYLVDQMASDWAKAMSQAENLKFRPRVATGYKGANAVLPTKNRPRVPTMMEVPI